MADLQSVSETNVNSISENITNKALPVVMGLPLISMFVCFILYFIGGYLLYVSLFAAIGSAVDSETDTQQFMMPITIPLILSIVLAQIVMKDHDGSMAFWLSQFPLTSPVIMLIRIPFGDVHLWEILLSVTILYASFVGTTFLAAKIYRTGILMYGKKINYKELIKWMKYK